MTVTKENMRQPLCVALGPAFSEMSVGGWMFGDFFEVVLCPRCSGEVEKTDECEEAGGE